MKTASILYSNGIVIQTIAVRHELWRGNRLTRCLMFHVTPETDPKLMACKMYPVTTIDAVGT